ncbi:MAG: hypothetical protein LBD41_02565, partial [Clostridiales Family XIII bacterium]|nr:hypothetical protein [Clostridiales Family XIII bacterium]
MNNLKSTNIIHIINISADRLADPIWDSKVKIMKPHYDLVQGELLADFFNEFANPDHFKNEGFTLDLSKLRGPSAKEICDEINDLKLRLDAYVIRDKGKDALYSGSLPVSLDIVKLKRLFPEELYTVNKKSRKHEPYEGDLFSKTGNEKIYTDAIINVTFDHVLSEIKSGFLDVDYGLQKKTITLSDFKGKTIKTTRELREKFYRDGMMLKFSKSLDKYVKYKRSSSKAREGSCLFIKEELKKKMSDWDAFGIDYENTDKNVLLAEIKAYESLTSSGIEKTVRIRPNEILLINDFVSKVKIKASVTTAEIKEIKDKKPKSKKTKDEKTEIKI